MSKANKKKSTPNKSSFKYASPTVATSLIVLGLLLRWGLPIGVGFIIGLVWMFRYSKDKPKFRLLWWLIFAVFIALEIAILVSDIHKYF